MFHGTDSEAARGNQDRERVLVQIMFPAHGPGILRFPEDGIDGYARDGDPVRRHAEGYKVDLRLLEGHEVMFAVAAEPHGVNVEVGHHHRVQDIHLLFPLEPGNDLGRQKMRADRNVGLVLVQELDEWNGVEPVKGEPDFLVSAGDVEMIVEPAQHLGRLVDQVDIGLGVKMTEDVVGVLEHIEVLNLGGQATDLQRLLDRVGRTKVACAGAGGKNQDSSQHLEPPPVRFSSSASFPDDLLSLLQLAAPVFLLPRKLRKSPSAWSFEIEGAGRLSHDPGQAVIPAL